MTLSMENNIKKVNIDEGHNIKCSVCGTDISLCINHTHILVHSMFRMCICNKDAVTELKKQGKFQNNIQEHKSTNFNFFDERRIIRVNY